MLGPLQDNGGPDAGAPGLVQPIFTHLPAQPSTVVDHVPAADCDDEIAGAPLLLADQRGLLRPFDGDDNGTADCDAGSVELQTQPTPPPPPPPPAGGGQPTTQQPTTMTTATAKKKCKKAKKRAAAAKKKCKKKRRK